MTTPKKKKAENTPTAWNSVDSGTASDAPTAPSAAAGAMPEHRANSDHRASDGRLSSGYNARDIGPEPRDDGQPNAAHRAKGTDSGKVSIRKNRTDPS